MGAVSEQYNQSCLITLDADLTSENADGLRKIVEDRITLQQVVEFAIDFEKCDFIDSIGLETLLWVKRRCEELFGQVRLVSLDENCRKILEMTRLDRCFECLDDPAEALKMMR